MPCSRTSSDLGLSRAALNEIYAHAEAGHPNEVCGLVFAARGEGFVDAEVRRCDNTERDARTAYSFSPRDLISLAQSQHTERPARIVYHSHVEVGAYWSVEDAQRAAPGGDLLYPCDHLVVDVRKDGARGCRLFRFDSGRFVEVAREIRP